MTECERFIKEGIFQKAFFDEEWRSEFLVSKDRKKIWSVELDLLSQFDWVCKKYGLTYFLFVGSLLGAVRHKGFVPWDDDIDLAMPRADYEKMLTLSNEFSEPYFLQSPWTDPGYYYSFAKLRNSRTSFVSKQFRYEKFNQGIMIDFHPIDVWCPDENGEAIYLEISHLAYDNSTYMRRLNPELSESDLQRVREYNGTDPLVACNKMRELGMSFVGKASDYVCRNTIGVYGYRRNLFRAEDFASTLEWEFEDRKVPIPVGYDSILKNLYGDYMHLPPVEKRGQWHSFAIVDPDRPYTCYLKTR